MTRLRRGYDMESADGSDTNREGLSGKMAQTLLAPAAVVDGVIGLHRRGDDVHPCKALKVFLRHMLSVLNPETLVVVAALLFDIAEDIENHGDCAVATRSLLQGSDSQSTSPFASLSTSLSTDDKFWAHLRIVETKLARAFYL